MEKTMFQILDEMNKDDVINGTRTIELSNTFVSADKVKQGAKISMGTEESILFDIASGKKIPILILVNKEEYFKRKK